MSGLGKLMRKSLPDKAEKYLDPLGVTKWTADLVDPKTPKLPPPVLLPDEEALMKARRRRLASSVGRTGRESTIMSEALGGV